MKNDRRFYVYVLKDLSKDGLPFYVGKGSGPRSKHHFCRCYLRRPSHKTHTILRYRSLGFSDQVEIIADELTEKEAFDLERQTIALFGRRCDGGSLVNTSTGGEGSSGFSVPRTPEWSAKISAALTGIKRTPEHIAKSSNARKGKSPSEEHRLKLSQSLAGKPKSPEHRARLSESQRGRKLPEDRKLALHAALRAKPADNRKWHEVTHPDGTTSAVLGLKAFCIERGLSNAHLGAVALGRRKHHKGFTARFINPPVLA